MGGAIRGSFRGGGGYDMGRADATRGGVQWMGAMGFGCEFAALLEAAAAAAFAAGRTEAISPDGSLGDDWEQRLGHDHRF